MARLMENNNLNKVNIDTNSMERVRDEADDYLKSLFKIKTEDLVNGPASSSKLT